MSTTKTKPMLEVLEGMLDELCSPELTLDRAKILRPRLFAVLDALDAPQADENDVSD